MAVAIRLARGGAKKRPYYRIVVADSRAGRDGKYLEQIGTYNPVLAKDSPDRIKLNEDRARYWIGVGAQPSDRVARFLDAAGIKERPARNNPNKAEPGKKAKDRAEDRATKAAEAEEAANAAKAEADAAVAEAVADDVPADAAPDEAAAAAEQVNEGGPVAEPAPAEDAPTEEAPAEETPAADAPAEDAGEEKTEG